MRLGLGPVAGLGAIRSRLWGWVPGGVLALALACASSGCSQEASPRQEPPQDAAPVNPYGDWRFPDAGDLTFPDAQPPGEDQCAGAPLVRFSGDQVVISGDTRGAKNEYSDDVRCGGTQSFQGGQLYYRLLLEQGTLYRLAFSPEFSAALYLFSNCSANVINADCGSAGDTGLVLGPLEQGETDHAFFTAPASGDFFLAIDSLVPDQAGAFEVTVDRLAAPSNGRCVGATPLSFRGPCINVQATTQGAADDNGYQLQCGMGQELDGPQVYYRLPLEADRWYRLTLAPEFAATLFVAHTAGHCLTENLEVDCSGAAGTVLPQVPAGGQAATAFSPPVDGEYLVVVDSTGPYQAGAFSLTIELFDPPSPMLCSAAQPLLNLDRQRVIQGSTAALLNDRGSQVTCGGNAPLVAPQAYYSADLLARAYDITLGADFPAVLAVGRSCDTLPIDCAAAGSSGFALEVPAGQTRTQRFTPQQDGTYYLAVDGTSLQGGTFNLAIQPYEAPENGFCAAPQILSFAGDTATVVGDTGPLQNDLAPIDCGYAQGPWPGPQAYFRVALQGGKTYQVQLVPEAQFDPALYALPAGTPCGADEVNAACKGLASDIPGAGLQEQLTLAPATDQDFLLVVDSWSASEVGTFTLVVQTGP